MSTPPSEKPHDSRPYKALDYFSEDDASRFFGREQDIARIASRITTSPSLVLYGRSGIGKTSILLAGVVPNLKARGFLPVYVRLLRSPLGDLTAAIATAENKPEGDLSELLRRADESGPLVIILDQLEELFTRFEEAEQHPFFEAVATALADAASSVHFVFSLREDYVAALDDFPGLSDLLDSRYRLRGLSAFGAREAIARPLLAAGIDFSEGLLSGLSDTLVTQTIEVSATRQFFFDPLLLQVVCTRVFQEAELRRPEAPRLEEQDLRRAGGPEAIFRESLSTAAKRVPKKKRLLFWAILDAMVSRSRTKLAVTVDKLYAGTFVASRREIEEILTGLVDAKLVRAGLRGDVTWYELVHDRLVDVVLESLDGDREYVQYRFARDLVEILARSQVWQTQPHALLDRGQLESVVGRYKARLQFGTRERELLLRSAVHRGSSDTAFWAERYGKKESASLLLSLLKDPAEDLRLPASRAAAALDDDDGALAEACLDAAFNDSSASVRRAAAASLATLATSREIEIVAARLSSLKTRKRAREVFADLIETERFRNVSSRFNRFLARRLRRKRTLADHAAEIAARQGPMALLGLSTSAVWWFVVGVPLSALAAWALSPSDWKDVFGWSVSVGLILFGLAGVFASRAVVRRVSQNEALGKKPSFTRALLAPWTITALVVVLALTELAPIQSIVEDYSDTLEWRLPLLLGTAGYGLLLLLVGSAELTLQGLSKRGVALQAAVIALGVPLLLPLAVVYPYRTRGAEWMVAGALAAAFCSGLSAILITALGFDAVTAKARETARHPRAKLARIVFGVIALASLVLIGSAIPRGINPYLAPVLKLDATPNLLDEDWPSERFRRVENDTKDLSVFDTAASADVVSYRFELVGQRKLLVVPPGHFPLQIALEEEKRVEAPYLTFTPWPVIDADCRTSGEITLDLKAKTALLLRLKPLSALDGAPAFGCTVHRPTTEDSPPSFAMIATFLRMPASSAHAGLRELSIAEVGQHRPRRDGTPPPLVTYVTTKIGAAKATPVERAMLSYITQANSIDFLLGGPLTNPDGVVDATDIQVLNAMRDAAKNGEVLMLFAIEPAGVETQPDK